MIMIMMMMITIMIGNLINFRPSISSCIGKSIDDYNPYKYQSWLNDDEDNEPTVWMMISMIITYNSHADC